MTVFIFHCLDHVSVTLSEFIWFFSKQVKKNPEMLISCIRGILLITAPDALLRVGKKFVKIQWMMKYKERKE